MKRDTVLWNGADNGEEAGAGERLTERSARFLDRLTDKLARHKHDAEQLAAAMRDKRSDP